MTQIQQRHPTSESPRAFAHPGNSDNYSTPAGLVVTILASLLAAWLAAGSVGLLAHSLRHAPGLVALGAILVAGWPRRRGIASVAALAVAAAGAIAMNASWLPVVNVLAPTLLLVTLGLFHSNDEGRPLLATGSAIAIFAIYRLILTSVPSAWLLADSIGRLLGHAGGAIAGQPLWLGATFGGLDFLVLASFFIAGWIALLPSPRWRLALYAGAAVLIAHLLYFVVLAYIPNLVASLPPPKPPPANSAFQQDMRTWADTMRDLLPWDLPFLAAMLHLIVVACVLRWTPRDAAPDRPGAVMPPTFRSRGLLMGAIGVSLLLPAAMTLGWCKSDLVGKKFVLYEKGINNWYRPEHGQFGRLSIGMYGLLPTYLQSVGAKVVLSPDLPDEDLKDADVLVLVYPNQPWDDTEVAHGQLQRISEFVQKGGSLLLFSDHTTREADGRNRANDVLAPHEFAVTRRAALNEFIQACGRHHPEMDAGQPIVGEAVPPVDFAADKLRSMMDDKPRRFAYTRDAEKRAAEEYQRLAALESLPDTKLRIRFDAAEFTVGGWLQSYEALAHPTNTGMHDDRNQFGVVIGASVEAAWPARPLLSGRWGWIDEGDQGSSSAMLGNHKYDPGEKLGDMILAAEQRLGKGRVIAFGDTSSFNNGINLGAHQYTSRLFSYLANGGGNPQAPSRQFIGFMLAVVLAVLLLRQPDLTRTGGAALGLAGSLAACTAWTWAATDVPPDGRRITRQAVIMQPDPVTSRTVCPRQEWAPRDALTGESLLAYIDVSHLPESSEESWRPDGCMGLAMSFMRDGYLTFMLHELTEDRIRHAAFLVSVAPSRPYSKAEREMLHKYVESGGNLIVTAGWDKCLGVQDLLNDFGLYVGIEPPIQGQTPQPPEPLGFFKSPYYDAGSYQSFVRYHAAWPVGPDPATTRLEGLRPIALGNLHGRDLPVILARKVGKGSIMLVGDTCFAMNKNLETEEGEAFDGAHENSDFWRWLIPQLTGAAPWLPPKPAPPAPPTTDPAAAPTTEPASLPLNNGPLGPPAPTTEPTTVPATMPADAPVTQPTTIPATNPTITPSTSATAMISNVGWAYSPTVIPTGSELQSPRPCRQAVGEYAHPTRMNPYDNRIIVQSASAPIQTAQVDADRGTPLDAALSPIFLGKQARHGFGVQASACLAFPQNSLKAELQAREFCRDFSCPGYPIPLASPVQTGAMP